MRKYHIVPVILLAGVTLGACSMQPEKNSALDEARAGYSAAQSNPDVTNLAAVELQQAGTALDKANEAQGKREDREVVDHLAYLTTQRVAIAEETARLKTAEAAVANAGIERDKVRLDVRTAEADAARRQAMLTQETTDQRMAELTAANVRATDRASQADARVSQMEEELEGLNARKTDRGMVITLGDVLFATNVAEIGPRGADSVHKLAGFLNEYPERTVLIEGFTDSTGSSGYNQELSDRRANAVRDSLISKGVSGDRVRTRGYGQENPVASNQTVAGRQMNRRVEVVFSDADGKIAPR